MSGFRQFYRKHGPFIIFIPAMIGIHWAWFRLQENELYVPREQKLSHPFIIQKDRFVTWVRSWFSRNSAETATSE